MTTKKSWDLLIKNVRVVRPGASSVEEADIAITGEKFAKVGTSPGGRRGEDSLRRQRLARLSRAWSTRTCTPASTRRSPKTR